MARILLSLPDDFLEKIDKHAIKEQRSRSELVRRALKSYIRKNGFDSAKSEKNAKMLDYILD